MRGLAAILIVILLHLAQPAFAGVFTDVPSGHPACKAIETLVDKGIITGVSRDIFAGHRRVTRYELAMSLFRAMARLEEYVTEDSPAVTDQDLGNIEYLKSEFAEELFLMGLRVEISQNRKEGLREEVDQLRADIKSLAKTVKNSSERIKMNGDWLIRHTWKSHRDDHARNAFSGATAPGNSNNVLAESQIRLGFVARVDDNITVFSRLRLFNHDTDAVSAAQSLRGGAWGLNGINGLSKGDMLVDNAFVEIKRAFHKNDKFVLGRSTMHTGHGLLLNADFDAVRYSRDFSQSAVQIQYIYDRHRGSYKDDAAVEFRGVLNAGCSRSIKSGSCYANIFAQNNPDLMNRRFPGITRLGTAPGEQKNDRRRDFEAGYTGKFGREKSLTADIAVALTDYRAEIARPAAGRALDVDLKGMAGHAALAWQAHKAVSAKLAWNFANDEFVGAYALDLDRQYCDDFETPIEDIARGNNWFRNGLQNLSDLKFQVEYKPEGRHYFRVAADFISELKDQVRNDLSHHLAGNPNGVIPVGFITGDSAYDTFNNIGVADPEMRIISCEYRYQLHKNTHLRVGAVKCDFLGSAFRNSPGSLPVPAGRGLRGDFDYQMLWAEIFSRF